MIQSKIKKRWRSQFIATLFLTLIAIVSQPMGQLDRIWSDLILTSKKSPITQQYLIVNVTTQDTSKLNANILPRHVLAETLTHLQDAGARRIMVDITLSEAFSSKSDPLLINAMKRLGQDRLAISQGSDPKFTSHATFVDLALLTDSDGWTREVRTAHKNSGYNPARWLAKGELSKKSAKVDLRYNPADIDRVSLTDILENPSLNISGRDVIISTDYILGSSRIQLPLSEFNGRSTAIVLGGQSVVDEYEQAAKTAWYATIGVALLLMSLGVYLASLINKFRFLILITFLMGGISVCLNLGLIKIWGGQAHPIMHFSCFLIGIVVTTFYRLRLVQMIAGFFKGDLSPEEAWAWRSHEDNLSPVILLDSVGKIRRLNSAAYDIKNLLEGDFGQKCFAELRNPTGGLILTDENGFARNFLLEHPNPAVAIMIIRDVTKTARQFDALEAEKRVMQKSIEDIRYTQNRALELAGTYQQEKIRVEEVSQLKSKFLANMSHELRTPLSAIIGFSNIMQREMFGPLGDARYKAFAGDILLSGQHLLSLINDILDLSKIEAGKMTLHVESIQLSKLISLSLRIVQVLANDKRISLIYDEVNLPEVKADPKIIKQVMLNLLTNAIKFTPEGGAGAVRVAVLARPTDTIISISDNGIGISQDDIERLAQPFEQVDTQDSKLQKGTGLGLALSKSMVELHGGQFKIESVLGKGTAVTFTLPNAPSNNQINAKSTGQTLAFAQ